MLLLLDSFQKSPKFLESFGFFLKLKSNCWKN